MAATSHARPSASRRRRAAPQALPPESLARNEALRTPLPPRSEAERRGGFGGGGHFFRAKKGPHPGAFGADPPRRSQALAGGGCAAAPQHFESGSEAAARDAVRAFK